MKRCILFFFCSFLWATYAQELPLLDRLSAIKNGDRDFYAIDGYTITNEDLKLPFDEKGFKKAYRKLKINAQDAQSNPRIHTDNYLVNRDKEEYVESLYFVKSPANTISLVWFSKLRDREVEVEESLVNPMLDDCYFTGINIVQCPYNGEMNWGVYRTLEDAQQAVAEQFAVNKQRKMFKPIEEEEVEVLFEEIPTKAKRVVFDIKGVASALAGMSGGKTLTVYYVAQVVRNRPIACVMSFWNNDNINATTGLPPLLSRVMQLK